MSDKLNRLCELSGILPSYYDIWGRHHEASEATKHALLAVLGHTGSGEVTEAEFDRAIVEAESSPWSESLPPVQIVLVGEHVITTYRVKASDLGLHHTWRIVLESGDSLSDEFQPSEQERIDSHATNGEELIALSLRLPPLDDMGYHRLEIAHEGKTVAACSLIACPHTAYLPASVTEGPGVWGLAVQLYSLRSQANLGLGDYGDLIGLFNWAKQNGADLVGLNPLHALFPHNPRHCSPYSPSSRQFNNTLYIHLGSLPELAECEEARSLVESQDFKARIDALNGTDLVDYQGVAELKYRVLELLYRHFRAHHLANGTERAELFRAYLARGGEDLRLFSLYHALQEHFYRQDQSLWGWPVWPEAYRSPNGPEVAAFAEQHTDRIEWQAWLQWLADEQLAAASRHAAELGLGIGLYQDLAVGVDKGGAETWMHRNLYALDCRIGCPPDDFNLLGQDWGLPPWIPQKLRQAEYRPYIAMLRANMKHAGALRIDHVMGLMRLYWIPPGMKGDAGAYLAYPLRDLLGILALESHRNRCIIVGEDLGTVPDEVRHALHEMRVLTYRLFYFERQQDGQFMPPERYPHQALVAATTHDLPTLAGYWKGLDIKVRTELALFPNEDIRSRQISGRAEDKAKLLASLAHEGLLPDGISTNPDETPELTPALFRAILAYIARTPARIALVQAEDMLGQEEQSNMPGTVDEHPNWRRKLPIELECWPSDEHCLAVGETMSAIR